MLIHAADVKEGMLVVGADGAPVGVVKAVTAVASLVDRPLKRDIFVPHYAIPAIEDGVIKLAIPAARVDDMGWPAAPLLGKATA